MRSRRECQSASRSYDKVPKVKEYERGRFVLDLCVERFQLVLCFVPVAKALLCHGTKSNWRDPYT